MERGAAGPSSARMAVVIGAIHRGGVSPIVHIGVDLAACFTQCQPKEGEIDLSR